MNRDHDVLLLDFLLKEKVPLTSVFRLAEKTYLIPLSVFSYGLTPLEAVCKYLRENEHLRYTTIASLLARDQRNIRASCLNARAKLPFALKAKETDSFIPVMIFRDQKCSAEEALVGYLLFLRKWSAKDIAKALRLSVKTVYTVKYRLHKTMEGAHG